MTLGEDAGLICGKPVAKLGAHKLKLVTAFKNSVVRTAEEKAEVRTSASTAQRTQHSRKQEVQGTRNGSS